MPISAKFLQDNVHSLNRYHFLEASESRFLCKTRFNLDRIFCIIENTGFGIRQDFKSSRSVTSTTPLFGPVAPGFHHGKICVATYNMHPCLSTDQEVADDDRNLDGHRLSLILFALFSHKPILVRVLLYPALCFSISLHKRLLYYRYLPITARGNNF